MSYTIIKKKDIPNLEGEHMISIHKWYPAFNLINISFHKKKIIVEDLSIVHDVHVKMLETTGRGEGVKGKGNYWVITVKPNDDYYYEYGPNHCGWLITEAKCLGYRPATSDVPAKTKASKFFNNLLDLIF